MDEVTGTTARSSRLGFASGTVIRGTYRLVRILGAGGFGEVWHAAQYQGRQYLRDVAIKLFAAPERGLGVDGVGPADRNDWVHEAQTIFRLCGATSVPDTYDCGVDTTHNIAFIAMELLRGEVLEARLARGPIPWRRALRIAQAIAEALALCHASGITHCDLKPRNVFITDAGRVVVLDFGIATLRGVRAGNAATGGSPSASSTFQVPPIENTGGSAHCGWVPVGTPGYISPEQLVGEPPDATADIYALGVLFYRMIAGRLPYRIDPALAQLDRPGLAREMEYHHALNAAAVNGQLDPLLSASPVTPFGVATLVDHMLARLPGRLAPDELLAAIQRASRYPFGVPDAPFVGPSAFGRERAGWLPGRDAEIERIVERLRGQRVVVLLGPAGAGKSSLAQAGVAARLDELLLDDTDGWEQIVIRPGVGEQNLHLDADECAAPNLRIGHAVIIENLEKVLDLDDAARANFCAVLQALVAAAPAQRRGIIADGRRIGSHEPARVIVTVREDLFARVAVLPGLGPFHTHNLVTVQAVDADAVREIVVDAARHCGADVEDPEAIIDEIAGHLRRDPGALPIIQLALSLWWDRDAHTRMLTRASWRAIGGIDGAVRQVADATHAVLTEADRPLMRKLLVMLFGADGARLAIGEGQIPPDTRFVLELMLARWLVCWRSGAHGRELIAVHRALIDWPLLSGWLQETRVEKELIEDARRFAARWHACGRPPNIPEALRWPQIRLEQANALGDRLLEARGFIEASHAFATEYQQAEERTLRIQQRWRLATIVAAGVVLVALTGLGYRLGEGQRRVAAASGARDKALADLQRSNAEVRTLRRDVAMCQAEQRRAYADQGRLQEQLRTCKTERDPLIDTHRTPLHPLAGP